MGYGSNDVGYIVTMAYSREYFPAFDTAMKVYEKYEKLHRLGKCPHPRIYKYSKMWGFEELDV